MDLDKGKDGFSGGTHRRLVEPEDMTDWVDFVPILPNAQLPSFKGFPNAPDAPPDTVPGDDLDGVEWCALIFARATGCTCIRGTFPDFPCASCCSRAALILLNDPVHVARCAASIQLEPYREPPCE